MMSSRSSLVSFLALLKRHSRPESMRRLSCTAFAVTCRCHYSAKVSTLARYSARCQVHFSNNGPTASRQWTINGTVNRDHRLQLRSFCQVAGGEPKGFSFVAAEEDKYEVNAARARSFLGNTDMYISGEKWKALKPKVIEDQMKPERVLNKFVMHHIVTLKYYEMGRSFCDYLMADKTASADEFLSRFLRMCLENEELEQMFKWYDSWREKKHIISSQHFPALIAGLCQTERWREGLEMLSDWSRVEHQPRTRSFHYVITAACNHGDLKAAMDLTKEMKDRNIPVSDDTVFQLLKSLRSKSAADKEFSEVCMNLVVELLNRHRAKRTYPYYDVVEEIQQWFKGRKDERWQTRFTGVHQNGTCRACRQQLEPLTISKEQFARLREQLLEKVIKGSDVFRKTTPEELQAFMKFVDEGAPYDIIIDGLNVAMLNNVPPKMHAKQLYQCVVYLAQERGYKCLVLGRHHMMEGGKWDKYYMDGITDLADCFFLENISKDDPFMLYATLHSGPNAQYVTKDMLRDHKALLDDEMNTAFFRWQKSQQLIPMFFKRGQIIFKSIFHADVVVQHTKDSWHIPYDDGTPRFSYQQPTTWLCASFDW